MSNIELQRDHNGHIHMTVDGRVASGARVASVQPIEGLGLTAIVWVPLTEVTMGEVKNVIPFVIPPK